MPGSSPGPKAWARRPSPDAAARRVLADAADPGDRPAGAGRAGRASDVKLVAAGSHPDLRWLERLMKEKGDGLPATSRVDQVRGARRLFTGLTAAHAAGRRDHRQTDRRSRKREAAYALVVDPRGAAGDHLFFLVSHRRDGSCRRSACGAAFCISTARRRAG